MTLSLLSVDHLSDKDLLTQVTRAADHERRAMAQLIALLMEVDARKLYLGEGCSSLFTYCTQVLHLSEHAAFGRIEAARAARKFPIILERLAEGAINLTTVCLLAPHLTPANHRETLEAAHHKRKHDVEQIVARLRPSPDVPSVVRKLSERKALPVAQPQPALDETTEAVASNCAPSVPANRPAEVRPLAPERYKVQFTVSRETYEQLRVAQDLLRHTIPTGDPGAIFARALALLVDELSRTKLAATEHPRSPRPAPARSRHVPAAVKRAVWQRDGGRCAFKGTNGRCTETGFLEFHHVVPFATGGKTTTQNLELRCKSHNAYEAELDFGPRAPTLAREVREAYQVDG